MSFAHQEVNVGAHEVDLVLHALLAVEVGQHIVDGSQPDGRAGQHTLPHTGVEVGGLCHLTELLQQRCCPGHTHKRAHTGNMLIHWYCHCTSAVSGNLLIC